MVVNMEQKNFALLKKSLIILCFLYAIERVSILSFTEKKGALRSFTRGYLKQRFLLIIVCRYIDYYIKKIKSQMNYSNFFFLSERNFREKVQSVQKICPLIGVSVNCLSAFWNVFYEDLT